MATPLKKWGPYLSERQWGTVREDYRPDGNAWDYFSHDHARSRAYRWGEDGLAGISDRKLTALSSRGDTLIEIIKKQGWNPEIEEACIEATSRARLAHEFSLLIDPRCRH
jgi:hypothetical protein